MGIHLNGWMQSQLTDSGLMVWVQWRTSHRIPSHGALNMCRTLLSLSILSLLLSGCGGFSSAMSTGTGSVSVGNITAEYYTSTGGMMLVIWLKHPAGGSHGGGAGVSSSPTKIVVTGNHRYGDAPAIEWRCETADGKSGSVTLDGA